MNLELKKIPWRGEVRDKLWGLRQNDAQQLSLGAPASMPREIIRGFAYLKRGPPMPNELGVLSREKRD